MSTETDTTRRPPTTTVRLSAELAAKALEVIEAEGITSAQFFDPLVASEIENRHKANLPAIKILRAAKARAAKIRDEAPVMANDLGGEV